MCNPTFELIWFPRIFAQAYICLLSNFINKNPTFNHRQIIHPFDKFYPSRTYASESPKSCVKLMFFKQAAQVLLLCITMNKESIKTYLSIYYTRKFSR